MALYVGGGVWGNDKLLQRQCRMADTRLEATNICRLGGVVAAATRGKS